MFSSKFVKRLVRERQGATGEPYTVARKHIVQGLIANALGEPPRPLTAARAGGTETFTGWLLAASLHDPSKLGGAAYAYIDEQGTFIVQVFDNPRFEILRASDAATMQLKLSTFAGGRGLSEQETDALKAVANAEDHLRSLLEPAPKRAFKIRPFMFTFEHPVSRTPTTLRGHLADDGRFVVTGCGREIRLRPLRSGLDEHGTFVLLDEIAIDLVPAGLKFVVGPDDGKWREKDAARLGFESPTGLDEQTSNKPDGLALVFFDEEGGTTGGLANFNTLAQLAAR